MPHPVEPFELRIAVQSADIDRLGHVNNTVYVRWVQEAAVAHWKATASPAAQAALAWIVARHEIDYERPAHLRDEVIVRTWVGTASRRAFRRHTELLRATDRTLLARALTVWCPIDPQTGKLVDVDDEVRAGFSVPGMHARA